MVTDAKPLIQPRRTDKCSKQAGIAQRCAPFISGCEALTDVMSWIEERRLSFLLMLFSRMKYFCA